MTAMTSLSETARKNNAILVANGLATRQMGCYIVTNFPVRNPGSHMFQTPAISECVTENTASLPDAVDDKSPMEKVQCSFDVQSY